MRRYSEWLCANFFNLSGNKKHTPHRKHADANKDTKDISGSFHTLTPRLPLTHL
jgi:hypothetical protein